MVGLVGALGEKQAVIVGHDWGAPVAWAAAQLRPDLFRAVAAYRHSGFCGELNWYRNIDRNWGISGPWDGLQIRQPALFISGTDDILYRSSAGVRAAVEKMPEIVPGLRRTVLLEGAGHWIQRERATEVSAALVDFLKGIGL